MQWTHHVELTSIYDVDITSIGRKENIDKFLRISTYFFNVVSMGEKSTSFRRTLFGVTSMSKMSTSFRYPFPTWFRWTKNQRCFGVFFGAIQMETWCNYAYFDVILKNKRLWSFWYLFLIRFWYIKNLLKLVKTLNVSFGLNIALMYFFKVILFHLEIY